MCLYMPLVSQMDWSTLYSCNLTQNGNMMAYLYIRILSKKDIYLRVNHTYTSSDNVTSMIGWSSELKRTWDEAVVAWFHAFTSMEATKILIGHYLDVWTRDLLYTQHYRPGRSSRMMRRFLLCRVYLQLTYVGCVGNRILRIRAPENLRLPVAMPLKPQESSTGVRLQAPEYSVLISCYPFRALVGRVAQSV